MTTTTEPTTPPTTTATATALSAQEAAIAGGRSVIHGAVTDRVVRLYEAIRA